MIFKLNQFKKSKLVLGAFLIFIAASVFAIYLMNLNKNKDFEISKIELSKLSSNRAIVEYQVVNDYPEINPEAYIEWGSDFNFTEKTKKKELPSDQVISEELIDLQSGKKYYFRLIIEGKEKRASKIYSFTTNIGKPKVETLTANDIEPSKASMSGNVLSLGGSDNVKTRFKWGAEKKDLKNKTEWVKIEDLSIFSKTIDGLNPNKKYYYQPEIKNEAGRSVGEVNSFVTNIGNAEVNLDPVSELRSRKTNIKGKVTDMGGDNKVDIWIEWGKSETQLNNKTSKKTQTEKRDFYFNLENLAPNTNYFAQAVVRNNSSTQKSNIEEFKTTYLLSKELRELIAEKEGEFKAEIFKINLENKEIEIIKDEQRYDLYYKDSTDFSLNPVTERKDYIDNYFESYEGDDCPEVPDEDLASYRLRDMEPSSIEEGDKVSLFFSGYKQKDYYLSRAIIER